MSEALFAYLNKGVSPCHAAANTAALLEQAGYARLRETESWNLQPGGGYYVMRGGSSVIAFRLPAKPLRSLRISAAHSDSPTFKIKPAEGRTVCGSVRLPVEGYGGILLPSWLDRPLGVAGRVLVRTEAGQESRLYKSEGPVCIIPSLCVHFDAEHGKGHALNVKEELQPVWTAEKSLKELAAEALCCSPEEILDTDLTLYPCTEACRVGEHLFMSPRIDDLECAFACLQGFLQAEPGADTAAVYCLFDSEEVGSGTRQGAQSDFLATVLNRMFAALEMGEDERAAVLAGSFCLSADNGHGAHPNYADRQDPENPVYLGKGLLIKYSANQKYTTVGLTGAVAARIFEEAGVAYQRFTNRADLPGGSTLGNLLSHSVSIAMVDIGAPQWAMHSCVETADLRDAEALEQGLKAYYRARFAYSDDGCVFAPAGEEA